MGEHELIINCRIMKKVFKYGTGQPIPEGAVYLGTVTQTHEYNPNADNGNGGYLPCWFVWHYFLVEVTEE